VTQAAAAANGESSALAAKPRQSDADAKQRPVSLEARLQRQLDAARKHRSVIHFFRNHRTLMSSADQRVVAQARLRRAVRRLTRVERTIAELRGAIRRLQARRLASAPPKVAICYVFGKRYCRQALAVAWCESRHSTTAQNGQYLGLFQMGSNARSLFGHGQTAHRQARAAHRYFVHSGRDWGPWSCKPWYAL
jgi:hypothetical protein